MYDVNGNQEHIKLTCSVIGAKPEITLFWTVNGLKEDTLNRTTTETQQLHDGTFTTTTIFEWVLNPSKSITCVASGAAVDGQAELHVSFMVTSQQGTTKRYKQNQLCLLLIKLQLFETEITTTEYKLYLLYIFVIKNLIQKLQQCNICISHRPIYTPPKKRSFRLTPFDITQ